MRLAMMYSLRLHLTDYVGGDSFKSQLCGQIHGRNGKIADGQWVTQVYSWVTHATSHQQLSAQFIHGILLEYGRKLGSSPAKPVFQKFAWFFDGREFNHIATLYNLTYIALSTAQLVLQFRLTDQDDGKQAAHAVLQLPEALQRFECLRVQIVGLLDDQAMPEPSPV